MEQHQHNLGDNDSDCAEEEDEEESQLYDNPRTLREDIAAFELELRVHGPSVRKLMEWVSALGEKRFGPADCVDSFYKSLPRLITGTLRKMGPEQRLSPWLLDFILQELHTDRLELYEVLCKLLTMSYSVEGKGPYPKSYLSDVQFDADEDQDNMMDEESIQWVLKSASDCQVSMWYMNLLEHFVEQEGPNMLLQRLSLGMTARPLGMAKPSPRVCRCILRIFDKVMDFFERKVARKAVEDIKRAVFPYVEGLSDDEVKNEDKTTIHDIMALTTKLVTGCAGYSASNAKDVELEIDIWRLRVAHKFFTNTKSLEKQLAGLHDILDVVQKVQMDDLSMGQQQPMYGYSTTLTTKFVVEWLMANRIVENLYGDKYHLELLKRCSEILNFLARNNSLQSQYLDIIWGSLEGKYEADAAEILNGIGVFFAYLGDVEQEYIFQKLTKVPFEKFTHAMFDLLCNFSTKLLHQNKSNTRIRFSGIALLWEFIQDRPQAVAADIRNEAIGHLSQALAWPVCVPVRREYLEKCMANFHQFQSVNQTLYITQSIIDSFEGDKGDAAESFPFDDHMAIEWLDQHHQIVEIMVDIVVDITSWFNAPTGPVSSLQPPVEDLECRLSFLSHILASSSLNLSRDQITRLWGAVLNLKGSPDAESWRQVMLKWFHELPLEVAGAGHSLSRDNCRYLYDQVHLLVYQHTSSLTEAAYNLFIRLFRYINMQKHLLTITDVHVNIRFEKEVVITSVDATKALDIFQKVAFEAESPSVGKAAVQHLIQLLLNCTHDIQSHQAIVRKDFLNACVQQLSFDVASTAHGIYSVELRLQRMIDLLQNCLQSFERHLPEPQRSSIQRHGARGEPCEITVSVVGTPSQVFTLRMNDKENLYALRSKIGHECRCPPVQVRIIMHGKECTSDLASLSDLNIKGKLTLHVAKYTTLPSHNLIKHDIPTWSWPSNILSSQDNFNKFFDLVADDRISPKLQDQMWNLILLLPTNKAMLASMSELSTRTDTEWGALFDQSNVFRLLYPLQILEGLIINARNQGDSAQQRMGGELVGPSGVAHLVKVFINDCFCEAPSGDRPFNPPNPKKARSARGMGSQDRWLSIIALLLRIIHFLAAESSAHGTILLESGATPDEFILSLLHVINVCSSIATSSSTVSSVVQDCFDLLAITVLSTRWLSALLQCPILEDWLQSVMLECKLQDIRKSIAEGIHRICTTAKGGPCSQVLTCKLLKFLDLIRDHKSTVEFFELAYQLLTREFLQMEGSPSMKFHPDLQPSEILHKLATMIYTHPITEKKGSLEEDEVLKGLATLLILVLKFHPSLKEKAGVFTRAGGEDFIRCLYYKCLFDIPTQENHCPLAPPKCKTKGSRKVMKELLLELCIDCPKNWNTLVGLLIADQLKSERNLWSYAPSIHDKSSTGYVGLKNLGATCYMNSLLQQLFMTRTFRNGVLSANLDPPYKDANEKQEAIMLQTIQSIYAYLQEGQKKFYDTRSFCLAYKDFDHQSVNPSIQMDVHEFLNIFFDKISIALKNTTHKDMLKQTFGGNIRYRVTGKSDGCTHVSEREEPFSCLELEAKSKKCLKESLELFVKEDVLDGDNKYKCDKCDKKVDAVRTAALKDLPNTMIMCLKRFMFDLDSMRKVKVTDYVEFPETLDLSPYSDRQDEDSAYFEFRLVGVLVHAGTADSGHYYSFIKERDTEDQQWYQFNDTMVEPFDPKDIENSCFGGTVTVTHYDTMQKKQVKVEIPKDNSAYLLWYERIQPLALPENCVIPIPADARCLRGYKPHSAMIHPQTQSQVIKPQLCTQVWEENMQFLRDMNLFDPEYARFLESLMHITYKKCLAECDGMAKESALETELQMATELGLRYFVETLAHAKEKGNFFEWISLLKGLLFQSEAAVAWFLQYLCDPQCKWLHTMLLVCIVPDVRKGFADIILHTLTLALSNDVEEPQSVPLVVTDIEDSDDDMIDEVTSPAYEHFSNPAYNVIGVLIKMLTRDVAQYWRHTSEYFGVLHSFALFGSKQRYFMLHNHHILEKCVELYDGDEHCKKKNKLSEKGSPPNLSHMMNLVSALVRSCHTESSTSHGIPPNSVLSSTLRPDAKHDHQLLQMPEPDRSLVMNIVCGNLIPEEKESFFERVLRDTVNMEALVEIAFHWSWESPSSSGNLIDICLEGINELDYDDFRPYFSILVALLGLHDSEHRARVSSILTQLVLVIDGNLKFQKATEQSFNYLIQLSSHNELVRQWFLRNLNALSAWLQRGQENVREAVCLLAYELVPEAREAYLSQSQLSISDDELDFSGPFPALTSAFPPLSKEAEADLRTLYNWLLGLLESAMHCTVYSVNQPEFKLVHYFRLLRFCIWSDQDKAQLGNHWDNFWDLLMRIDQHQYDNDLNKQEATYFLYVCAIDYIPNLELAMANVTRLMGWYVSIGVNKKQLMYNTHALPCFYHLLLAGAKHDKKVCDTILRHRTWDWAVMHMYFDSEDYPGVADSLEAILDMGCMMIPTTRLFWVKRVVETFRHSRVERNDYAQFRTLAKVFEADTECLKHFLSNQGLWHMCAYFELKYLSDQSRQDDPEAHGGGLLMVVKHLASVLKQCFLFLKGHLNDEITKSVMVNWYNRCLLVKATPELLTWAHDESTRDDIYYCLIELCCDSRCCNLLVRVLQNELYNLAKGFKVHRCHPSGLLIEGTVTPEEFLAVFLPKWISFMTTTIKTILQLHPNNEDTIRYTMAMLCAAAGEALQGSQQDQQWKAQEIVAYFQLLQSCAPVPRSSTIHPDVDDAGVVEPDVSTASEKNETNPSREVVPQLDDASASSDPSSSCCTSSSSCPSSSTSPTTPSSILSFSASAEGSPLISSSSSSHNLSDAAAGESSQAGFEGSPLDLMKASDKASIFLWNALQGRVTLLGSYPCFGAFFAPLMIGDRASELQRVVDSIMHQIVQFLETLSDSMACMSAQTTADDDSLANYPLLILQTLMLIVDHYQHAVLDDVPLSQCFTAAHRATWKELVTFVSLLQPNSTKFMEVLKLTQHPPLVALLG